MAAAASALALGALASKLLGFGRDAVFAAVFGAGREIDAFLVAQSVPNIAITLLSSAVATASIPVLTGLIANSQHERAARTFGALITLSTSVVAVACLGMALIAEELVALLAPGFDQPQIEFTAHLTRILLAAGAFVAATSLLSAFLQAHGRFALTALVGIPFNLVMIAAALVFGDSGGVASIAVGFVIGSALRVLVLLPGLRSLDLRWRPILGRDDEHLRSVLRLVPALVVGYAIADVNGLVDRLVGSQQETGTISALNYAYRLVRLPYALIVVALVQALYPSFGGAVATEDRARFGELVTKGLQVMTIALAPVSVLLFVLREPVIDFVYGRGSFDESDTALTSAALAGYSFGLITLALREVVSRGLFSLRDTRTPTLIALIGMVANGIGDIVLGRALGAFGLALTTTLSFSLIFFLTARALGRRAEFPWDRWWATVVRVVPSSLLLGLVSWATSSRIDGLLTSFAPELADLARVVIPSLAGLASYGLVVWLLRTPGFESITGYAVRMLTSMRRKLTGSARDR